MGKPAQELLKDKKYDVLISTLTDRFGTDGTATIWLDAEHRLEGFLKTTAKLSSGEQLHAEGTIYPACAIYLAIAERCGRDEAFQIMETFMRTVALEAGAKLQKIVKPRFMRRIFMKGFGVVGSKMFGETAGFEQKLYENKSTHLRMDILACPYLRHCIAADARELAPLFCANDEYAYGNLPGIEFKRAGTLARGNDRCDFELTLKG